MDSRVMEETYANVEFKEPVERTSSINQTGSRSSQRRFHGAVVWFLGLLSLLLLAGIIGLGNHYNNSTRDSSAIKTNLTERLQASDDQLSALTEQRDLLNVELKRLQGLLKQKKTCPAGWKMFHCSCYLFSTHKKSWDESRQYCRAREADLVIIDSLEEQGFVINNIKGDTWFGLSDKDKEGTWKWADDTPLTKAFWDSKQPDNGGGSQKWGEEDCAHFKAAHSKERNWNDLRCDVTMLWVCEK